MTRELKFPGQKHNEQIQLLVRKHWIIDVKIGLSFFVLGALPTIAGVIGLSYYHGGVTKNFLIMILVFLVYFLFMHLRMYVKWLNEELDVIIVTNERVLSHDQVDLFHREISETSISQIQDVVGIEKGLLGHLFHFGTLKVQTAAQHIVFNIQNVGQPYSQSRRILDIRDKYIDKEKFEPNPNK